MKTIKTRFLGTAFATLVGLSLFACSNVERTCKVTHFFEIAASGDKTDQLYVGNVYFLHVSYDVGSENNKGYSFTSYISANDNIVVSYIEGENCTVNGNYIEVNYGNGASNNFISIYKLDVKSRGTSYLKFKNLENISLSPSEIKLEVESK